MCYSDSQMLTSKDVNFMGYTYKNYEIVNESGAPRIVELKKKSTKPKRPSIKTLFSEDSESGSTQSAKGSFLNLLPPPPNVSKSDKSP